MKAVYIVLISSKVRKGGQIRMLKGFSLTRIYVPVRFLFSTESFVWPLMGIKKNILLHTRGGVSSKSHL